MSWVGADFAEQQALAPLQQHGIPNPSTGDSLLVPNISMLSNIEV